MDLDNFVFGFIVLFIFSIAACSGCSDNACESSVVRQLNNGDWVTVKITGQHGMIVAYYHEHERPECFTGSYDVRFEDYSIEKFRQYELKPYEPPAPLPSPAPEPEPTVTASPIVEEASPEGAVFGQRTWNPATRRYE